MCANSEGSGETGRLRRLDWAFNGRLCDKYHNLMSWLILSRQQLLWSVVSGAPLSDGKQAPWYLSFEPHHKKTCLRGLRPGKTQSGLCSHRS